MAQTQNTTPLDKSLEKIQNSFNLILSNPVKSFFLPGSYKRDHHASQIASELVLLGFENRFNALLDHLSIETNDRFKLDLFIGDIYKLYDDIVLKMIEQYQLALEKCTLESEEQAELLYQDYNRRLKKLKKHIHAFADAYGLEKKIINIDIGLIETQDSSSENRKYKKNKRFYLSLQSLDAIYRDQHKANSSNENPVSSPNTEIPANGASAVFIDNLKNLIKTKEIKDKERTKKKIFSRASLGIGMVVGIANGMLATVFAISTFGVGVLFAFLFFGLISFVLNTWLTHSSCYTLFVDFGLGRYWKKWQGLSTPVKVVAASSILLAFGTALTMGFLFFSSMSSGFIAVFAVLGLTAAFPPLGIAIMAITIATISFFAMGALMYSNLSKFFINKDYIKAKNFILSTFIPNSEAWEKATSREKAAFVIKSIFRSLFLIAGLAIGTVGAIATLGVMAHSSVTVMEGTLKLGIQISNLISNIFIYIFTTPTRLFFSVKNTLAFFNDMVSAGSSIGKSFMKLFRSENEKTSPIQTERPELTAEQKNANTYRILNTVFYILGKILTLGLLAGNTLANAAQGGSPYGIAAIHNTTHVSNALSNFSAKIGSGIVSLSVNGNNVRIIYNENSSRINQAEKEKKESKVADSTKQIRKSITIRETPHTPNPQYDHTKPSSNGDSFLSKQQTNRSSSIGITIPGSSLTKSLSKNPQ